MATEARPAAAVPYSRGGPPGLLDLANHFLHTAAFCLTISALLFFLQPARSYEHPMVYSLLIGTITWAVMDVSRMFLPLDPETGWHKGVMGVGIVAIGITLGFLVGTTLGDMWFGVSSWDQPGGDVRTSVLITILAGTTGSVYFYSRGRSARLQAKVEMAQRTAAEAKLKLLETQLEPHMLFNTLANLRALIAVDPPRAQDMLDRLIAYLRATLSASRALTHPLADEFARLDDYLQLMAVRMGSRMAYTLDLPDELRAVPVPPLLLQPLVENAIKHGLEPHVGRGEISVRASREGDVLRLDVQDSGVGLPDVPALPAAGGGFGLGQVRERLATAYGSRASLAIAPAQPRGTHVTLLLPPMVQEADLA